MVAFWLMVFSIVVIVVLFFGISERNKSYEEMIQYNYHETQLIAQREYVRKENFSSTIGIIFFGLLLPASIALTFLKKWAYFFVLASILFIGLFVLRSLYYAALSPGGFLYDMLILEHSLVLLFCFSSVIYLLFSSHAFKS